MLTATVVGCAPVTRVPTVDPKEAAREAEKQRELFVTSYVADSQRLHRVTYRILRDNAEFCGEKVRAGTGIKVIDEDTFKDDYRAAATRLYGFGDGQAAIVGVALGSPADRAGIRVGDVVTGFAGRAYGEEAKREQKSYQSRDEAALAEMAADERSRDEIVADIGRPVNIDIQRDGQAQKFTIVPEPVCAYGDAVAVSPLVNAMADGHNIVFTTAMMRFAKTDDELAVVVGHEVAHNHMGHIDKQHGNQAIGFLFDLVFAGFGVNTQGLFTKLAGQAFSQAFEAEADYVGLYMAARAGFPIETAPKFWRRMAEANPASIEKSVGSTHPSTPERFVALEKTVDEIDAKIAAHAALTPELKDWSLAGGEPVAQPGRDSTDALRER